MNHHLTRRASLAAIGALAVTGTRALAAEATPPVIRIGGVGYGYGKQFGQNAIAIAQAQRLVEAETKGAVRVEYQYFDHTGPAINEAIAGGQLDFASYGALPQIIGKANGLQTRIIANGGVSNIYVGVRTGVKANTIADLKGLPRYAAARYDLASSAGSPTCRSRLVRERHPALRSADGRSTHGPHQRRCRRQRGCRIAADATRSRHRASHLFDGW